MHSDDFKVLERRMHAQVRGRHMHASFAVGSPPHNLTGLYNLTVFLLHKLVLNVRKLESNMAAFCKDILSGPRPLFYLVLVLFYFLLIDY